MSLQLSELDVQLEGQTPKDGSRDTLCMQDMQEAMCAPSLAALNSLGLTDLEDYVMGEEPEQVHSSATAAPLSAAVLHEQPPAARSGTSPPAALFAPLHAAIRSFSLSRALTTPHAAAPRLCFDQPPEPHENARPGAGESTAAASSAPGMPAIPPAQARLSPSQTVH